MNMKKLLIIFVAFLVLQPIIDILTTASLFVVGSGVTIGVVVRAAYMVAILALLLWLARTDKLSRVFVAYLLGLAALLVINTVLNMQVKDPYYLFQELKFFNKVIYFHITFLGLIVVYRELKKRGWNIADKTTHYFWLSGIIIAAVFIIAQITGTSLANYSHTKVGFTGWFYAGNEIGAIMAIILPIVALYGAERTNSLKSAWAWIPFILLSLGMLALGTKVGYGGILIVLLSVLIGSAIMLLMKQRTSRVKANLLVSAILTAVLLATTPFTPVFGNMFAHISSLGINLGQPVDRPGEEVPIEGEELPEEEPTFTSEQVQNLVFSSREKYELAMREDFFSSPITQQLFGMGFAGNYPEPEPGKTPKMIEMDFHDWFYSFGWIGFIYLMAPLAWFAGRYILHFVKNLKTHFNYFYILYGVGFLLGIGIAYTAGHVLTAPAVSIYLAAILAMLVVKEELVKKE